MPQRSDAIRSEPRRPLGSVSLRRLVVGYDGSTAATSAAAFALWLAGETAGEVTLLHASADAALAPEDRVAAYELEWQQRLDSLSEAAFGRASVQCRLERTAPAAALIGAARQANADLVLIGAHGVGRLQGALLGSVSAQVVTHAPGSVMLFPEDVPAPPQAGTVVVGVDGSEPATYALAVAQALAVPLGAQLVLVAAYDPTVPFKSDPTTAMLHELERHARQVLQDARASVRAPLDTVLEEVRCGRPREALVAAAAEHAPAVLVVGNRGLGGFRELLLGSTSRAVANVAPCPVLVARPLPAA